MAEYHHGLLAAAEDERALINSGQLTILLTPIRKPNDNWAALPLREALASDVMWLHRRLPRAVYS